MNKNKKETNKIKFRPKTYLKILGFIQILIIPILVLMALAGQIIVTFSGLVLNKFKDPKSYFDKFRNETLEILSKNFIMSIFYSNLFMIQTGIHYDEKTEFLLDNPDFLDNLKNNKKSIFSIDLSIPFVNNKKDEKTEEEEK